MQVLDPEILDLTRELSPAVSGVVAVVGLALWFFGAHSHRFWIALVMTVTAGLIGLNVGREFDVLPLVAGLLLALAAGLLALALTRLSLFVLGGLCAILVVRMAVPAANELLCFLVGGLIGVCFYQLWITALSSFTGTVLVAYALASLMHRLGWFDSVAWARANTPLINWGLIACTVMGILTQFLLDGRREKKKLADRENKAKEKVLEKEKEKLVEKEEKVRQEEEARAREAAARRFWWDPRKLFGDRAA